MGNGRGKEVRRDVRGREGEERKRRTRTPMSEVRDARV